jgi:hypothetical protein
MVRKVAVSKKGLTKCPECHAFIKVASDLADTVCTFCGSHLATTVQLAESPRFAGLFRVIKASRSGLLAASLLGIGGLSACDNNSKPTTDVTDVVKDTVNDTGNVAPYGLPPDIGGSPDVPGDISDAGPDAASSDVKDTADAPILPPYGIPPDANN